jgi:predicted nucleotidyltransferase
MNHNTNRLRIKAVHNSLAALNNKVVFVGGSTVSLYADIQTLNVRPTDDVDVILEILNYSNRSELEAKLRSIGFQHDIDSGVICRFRIQGIIVDVMSTTPDAFGFSNKWYPEGFATAIDYVIDETVVKILSVPYFIATKLEAFKSRGRDGRTSPDFEDIVYVLENRQTVWGELAATTGEIKKYLQFEFTHLRKNPSIFEWIDCHVEYNSPPPTYAILEKMDQFIV